MTRESIWTNSARPLLLRLIVLAVILLAIGITFWWYGIRPTNNDLLTQVREAYSRRRFNEALRAADRLIERKSDLPEVLLLAAHAASNVGEHARAVAYYDRIENDGSPTYRKACVAAGEILLLKLHEATAAEIRLRQALECDPNDTAAINRLAYLYSVEGRTLECVEMLFRQIRGHQFTIDHLLMLGKRSPFVDSPSVIDNYLRTNPEDLVPLVSRARIAVSLNRKRGAVDLLQRVLRCDDRQIEAYALMGRALLEIGEREAFLKWHHSVPREAEVHPMIWLVRGHWARRQQDEKTAVRCYWESLRHEPQDKSANFQLAQSLIALGEPDRAEMFLSRAQLLDELETLLDKILSDRQDVMTIRAVAEQMEAMGRLWEAWGWSRVATSIDRNAQWAHETIARVAPKLNQKTPLTLVSHRPGWHQDWTRYPLPQWPQPPYLRDNERAETMNTRRVAFVDSAKTLGIDFQYFNGHEGQSRERRIFEQMGGGVAVLDFDVDGWPDLYFTQGSHWPPKPAQTDYLDRLYRNLGDGTFDDVTTNCRITEWRYGQGVTVGDFNNDGFQDLLIANIGSNRLFENNGDGTFSDVTSAAEIAGDDWSTSCLMADLNGDGAADVYSVNYLDGEDVFSRICRDSQGRLRICAPSEFRSAQDRVYVNLGDGRFVDQTAHSGIRVGNGTGLGIVAADLDRSHSLSLFVANDQQANFLFRHQTSSSNNALEFKEVGLTSGLAYDQDGLALACMGIAVGDTNADGLFDLFVTNYAREANTLYLQLPGGQFADRTQQAQLQEGSFGMLGFGCQFIDGELDGHLDLVLTNGHVNNIPQDGDAYRMRPQYYSNTGDGTFVEVQSSTLGPFFEADHVGRGLARIDWDRDGREDVVISDLESHAAVLTNSTPDPGNSITLRFVGVKSSRDAIGTTAVVSIGGRKLYRQLTAGDGYQASNQRQLVFGLGKHDRIDQLEIDWPSGLTQTLSALKANVEYLIIEGHSDIFRIPK